ncbi:ArsR/SmtB family transcription factor [Candidatus Venteria ishoeyi]|uniref:Helix-turn-helix domain protein n=1 Tax=Candidatus Venteria ishoeyi TaxID=1899563 RepID=A0A1H6FA08_9GAMM|nr:metalloregulator ArsR/SmtB family transcription factor [Candidatus Venteria ishoeyi]MDM8546348.1 metalloregulator ArsR/SmtB family transcription factor [Candidatus Venteria ishoeyi]SEH06927.1 Helix-turn-helix domain protein [Candidatus Venteria ishoeyi]
MSNIKTLENDLPVLEQYAKMFKALSNPVRLRIFLRSLEKHPPGMTCDIDVDTMLSCQRSLATEFGLAPSTISHHVKELSNVGLLHVRRDGQRVLIWVDAEAIQKLDLFFGSLS